MKQADEHFQICIDSTCVGRNDGGYGQFAPPLSLEDVGETWRHVI